MASALDPSITLSLQPKTLIGISCPRKCTSNIITKSFPSPKSMAMVVRCSSATSDGGLKDALSAMVDKRVEELLGREENKGLLDKLNQASQRVEIARQQLADIQRQEIEAQQMRLYIKQLESKAAEIAEFEKEVLEARAMVEEAERSLSMAMETEGNAINRDEERWESVKAASISALVGTLAGLPIYLTKVPASPELLLQLGVTFASCALFGVTFRYAVRRDLDNIQLKTGTSAAFAFVKGLATLTGGRALELDSASFLAHALDGALFVSQDLFVFIFAAVSLDFCFKTRIVSPFPIRSLD
ncbi:hypothetical protein Cgig2_026902 [Carnegiea gigantea]|uniref:Uncharacterized protein n=1 Tax=Carnegiea gigantea TaxID=171969 RepID=A0A9Q1QQ42_9CARY|nr:hypothetical protein Cgig2_026902 [Carnegiea gigantea]